jgi:hypothetical protein
MKSSYLLLLLLPISAYAKTLVFIDNTVSNDTYIASNKERQISVAYKMGLEKISKICSLESKQEIGKEPLSIFNQAKSLKKMKGSKVLFGLIHSSEALLAAEAFKDDPIVALSSGAATDQLHLKNRNFFSLANPISKVSEHVINYISKNNLKNAIAIIPGNSSYSVELSTSLKNALEKTGSKLQIITIDTNRNHEFEIKKVLANRNIDFIYTPGFIQQTLPIFESIAKTGYNGIIYGSANLARSKTDLKLFSSSLNIKNLKIRFPASWISGESIASKSLESNFLRNSKEEIMGTAVFTYDAVIITGHYLCSIKNEASADSFEKFVRENVIKNRIPTIRKYADLNNGHLISNLTTVSYNSKTQSLDKE